MSRPCAYCGSREHAAPSERDGLVARFWLDFARVDTLGDDTGTQECFPKYTYCYFMYWGKLWLSDQLNNPRKAAVNFRYAIERAATDEEAKQARHGLLMATLAGGVA